MPSTNPQVSGYPAQQVKDELARMAESRRGLSISVLVQEAIDIALPELRKRYEPTEHPPGRRRRKAA